MTSNVEIPEWKLRLAQQYFKKGKNESTSTQGIPIPAASRKALESSEEDNEEFESFAVSPSKRTIEVKEFISTSLCLIRLTRNSRNSSTTMICRRRSTLLLFSLPYL